jgi:hypothetical protein
MGKSSRAPSPLGDPRGAPTPTLVVPTAANPARPARFPGCRRRAPASQRTGAAAETKTASIAIRREALFLSRRHIRAGVQTPHRRARKPEPYPQTTARTPTPPGPVPLPPPHPPGYRNTPAQASNTNENPLPGPVACYGPCRQRIGRLPFWSPVNVEVGSESTERGAEPPGRYRKPEPGIRAGTEPAEGPPSRGQRVPTAAPTRARFGVLRPAGQGVCQPRRCGPAGRRGTFRGCRRAGVAEMRA